MRCKAVISAATALEGEGEKGIDFFGPWESGESGESWESWSVLMAAVIEFRQNSGQRQQLMSSGALKGVVSIVVIWGTSGGLCFFVNLEQGLALRAVEDENTEADS